MKSQVNALLHVMKGLHKDILSVYPAMGGDLDKDFERVAHLCQDRGLGLFTLDLPSLEAALLSALDTGRLSVEGPLSTRKSKTIQVPRLYSGLWLRIFDEDASLKTEVDVTALFFLRQVLTLGKKIEVKCSFERKQTVIGAYHDVERELNSPTLDWAGDDLTPRDGEGDSLSRIGSATCNSYLDGSYYLYPHLHVGAASSDEASVGGFGNADQGYSSVGVFERLHLVQALDDDPQSSTPIPPLLALAKAFGEVRDRSRSADDARLLTRIQQVADLVTGSFPEFDPISYSEMLEEQGLGIGFRHGPGAVAERRENWEKSQFPNWSDKLNQVFPFELCGKSVGSSETRPLNHEVASRLICVPKTAKGPRLIAAEPTSHQWCQQLILKFLFDQCSSLFKGSFIDFKDQSKSGDLVLQASRNRDLATVDLSDASDRLTCWTVERMFRRNQSILTALHAARTRYLRDEILGDVSFLKLKKFASQGTATTFPVMSLVMLFIALGSSLKDEEPVTWQTIWKYRNQVRVFGDDIIVPMHGYTRLCRAMALVQLKVNIAKSYNTGYFRESCGVDGYRGYDVTPVKPKTLSADSPASRQAVVDTTNNLFNKGLWHASTACFSLLPLRVQRTIRTVGILDAGFGGVTSYSGGDESHLVKRWNSRLHRYEVRVWSLSGPALQEHPRDGFVPLLDFFASKHNHEHARIVSSYGTNRKTRDGLQWEPANPRSRVSTGK